MSSNFFIVNSYHPAARYVPMGSFGICDLLERHGHRARIFNCALYPADEQAGRLEEEISGFAPRAIGLIDVAAAAERTIDTRRPAADDEPAWTKAQP